jgi:hypothetical protein
MEWDDVCEKGTPTKVVGYTVCLSDTTSRVAFVEEGVELWTDPAGVLVGIGRYYSRDRAPAWTKLGFGLGATPKKEKYF